MVAAGELSGYLRSRVRLHAYMERDLSSQQLAAARDMMVTSLSTLGRPDQVQFRLVTKDEAAEDFKKSSGEDFVAFLGTNPLRDYYEIALLGDANTPEHLEEAQIKLSKIGTVFEVTYLKSLAASLARNLRTGAFVLGGLALILCLAAAALVSNTVSLQLFGKRFLVRSMQLVGARPGFVLRPFVSQAALLCGLAAVLASGVLASLYFTLGRQVVETPEFLPLPALGLVCLGLLAIGLLLGVATSFFTIRRYLRLPLDKLI